MSFLVPKRPSISIPAVREPPPIPQQAVLGKASIEKFKLRKIAKRGKTILTEGFFDDDELETKKLSLFGE